LISIVPGFIGIVIGVCLGYACALLILRLSSFNPKLHKWLILIPWRSTAISFIIWLLLTPFITIRFGIGYKTGAIIVGLSMIILAIPLTAVVLIENQYPSLLLIKIISVVRMLAVVSMYIGVFTGWHGGSKLGFLIQQEIQLLNYPKAINLFLILLFLVFIIDILFGFLQFLIFTPKKHKRTK